MVYGSQFCSVSVNKTLNSQDYEKLHQLWCLESHIAHQTIVRQGHKDSLFDSAVTSVHNLLTIIVLRRQMN